MSANVVAKTRKIDDKNLNGFIDFLKVFGGGTLELSELLS